MFIVIACHCIRYILWCSFVSHILPSSFIQVQLTLNICKKIRSDTITSITCHPGAVALVYDVVFRCSKKIASFLRNTPRRRPCYRRTPRILDAKQWQFVKQRCSTVQLTADSSAGFPRHWMSTFFVPHRRPPLDELTCARAKRIQNMFEHVWRWMCELDRSVVHSQLRKATHSLTQHDATCNVSKSNPTVSCVFESGCSMWNVTHAYNCIHMWQAKSHEIQWPGAPG